jgi:hypothetical protein
MTLTTTTATTEWKLVCQIFKFYKLDDLRKIIEKRNKYKKFNTEIIISNKNLIKNKVKFLKTFRKGPSVRQNNIPFCC